MDVLSFYVTAPMPASSFDVGLCFLFFFLFSTIAVVVGWQRQRKRNKKTEKGDRELHRSSVFRMQEQPIHSHHNHTYH